MTRSGKGGNGGSNNSQQSDLHVPNGATDNRWG